MKTLRILPLILMLSLCACMGRQAQWAPAGSQAVLSDDQLDMEWPQGWMTLRPAEKDAVAVKQGLLLMGTRDGFGLQNMRLHKRALDGEFTHTQKKLSAEMLPQEVAEVILDDLRANPEVVDLNVVDHRPSTVAGVPGFRLTVTYRGKSGLLRQSALYGCTHKGMLVLLSFDAPKRHYFAYDLATFETMKDSLHWKS